MQEIRKALVLDKKAYYVTHLSILNCLLPITMTPMEINVLAEFMSLEGNVAAYRFGPTAKKMVMTQLHLSPAGLSNYVKSLADKGFIDRTEGVITIIPILIPEQSEQFYRIKISKSPTPTTTGYNNDALVINAINSSLSAEKRDLLSRYINANLNTNPNGTQATTQVT